MAYRWNEQCCPCAGSGGRGGRLEALAQQLRDGTEKQRLAALRKLIRARAEDVLVECLTYEDEAVVQLATCGLWQVWLGEKGTKAQSRINRGIDFMQAGDLTRAEQVFLELMTDYPDWAEPVNKQATLLYLRQQPAVSLAMCRQVVALKPHHFGAWNGLALCALQLREWETAREAAENAARLLPSAPANHEIIQFATAMLSNGED